MTARQRRLLGAAATAGAFVAFGAAPAANADFDDLIMPVIDDLFGGVDPSLAADTGDPSAAIASLDTLFEGWYQDLVTTPIHDVEQWFDGGSSGTAAATAASASSSGTAALTSDAADTPSSFTIPLAMHNTTEPVVDVSVGGGAQSSVLVDTGSTGLVMPEDDVKNFNWFDVNWFDLQYGSYGSGDDSLGYFYTEMPETLTFTNTAGDTVTTGTTDVDVVLFSFPTGLQSLLDGDWTLGSYLKDDADGVMGIGVNAIGPGDSSPLTALPGDLSDGVLINESGGTLTFGSDTLSGGTTVDGAPYATVDVSFNGGPLQQVSAIMDSGGSYGSVSSSLLKDAGVTATSSHYLPNGTTVAIYSADGKDLLAYYTVDTVGSGKSAETNGPVVVSGDDLISGYGIESDSSGTVVPFTLNTGNEAFLEQQVYVSNTDGTTTFGG